MTEQASYGKMTKRIVFTDNDHRHAQLLNRLRYDGLTQAQFFRLIVGGYIAGDGRIQEFVDEFKTQSIKRKKRSRALKNTGEASVKEYGLDSQSIEDIFDLIAEEHPDL